ncbi:MAG: HlyD family efflux transporter periplasmic adaptor subunit [Moraxella equi]|nr:HlyD family efflux transporter periplasmic adaptor subunit [Moraxella equi]
MAIVFSPIVLNNHGGTCQTSPLIDEMNRQDSTKHTSDKEMRHRIHQYQDSKARPYIHLLDGGLTDNLGMRGVLDLQGSFFGEIVAQSLQTQNISRVIMINVNAQNQVANTINQTPNEPKFSDVVSAIINIPIDQNSQTSLQQMRLLQQVWQEQYPEIKMNFISVNLQDLPESLIAIDAVSRQAYDDASTNVKKAESALAQALAQKKNAEQEISNVVVNEKSNLVAIDNAKAGLALAELELSYTTIKAPVSGRLGEITAKEGQLVAVGTNLMSVVPPEHWLIANVKETEIGQIAIGQPAQITVDALSVKGAVSKF